MDRHNLWIYTDVLKRKNFIKNEIKRTLLKSFCKNKTTALVRRYLASYYLTTLPRISSKTKYSNRCVISGRVWAVNKQSKLNRFVLRREISNSSVPGCRRASW